MKKTFLMFFTLFAVITAAMPIAAEGFNISGRVLFCTDGVIHVILTDQEKSAVPFEGVKMLTIKPLPSDFACGYIDYEFKDVPAGAYGISCFQDIDGNGRLTSSLFGPSEPWGMSWSEKRIMNPEFKDYSFAVDRDLDVSDIILYQ